MNDVHRSVQLTTGLDGDGARSDIAADNTMMGDDHRAFCRERSRYPGIDFDFIGKRRVSEGHVRPFFDDQTTTVNFPNDRSLRAEDGVGGAKDIGLDNALASEVLALDLARGDMAPLANRDVAPRLDRL